MKKFILFCIISLTGLVSAQAYVLTGSCGTNVTYTFDTESCLLKIEGSGAMADYEYSRWVPWTDYRKNITKAEIGDGVTSIGKNAFIGCTSLTSVSIPGSVIYINGWAFEYCSCLTSVDIPDSVTSIGSAAFAYCTNLTSVIFGNSLTIIGESAFAHCSGLQTITSYATVPPVCRSSVFSDIPATAVLKVYASCADAYRQADQWKDFIIETIPDEEDEDGIRGINDNVDVNDDVNENIYNLSGQRINKLQKGINIVGGRKVLVK